MGSSAPSSTLMVETEQAEGVYFREMGKLTGTLGWAHLGLKVNLTRLEENLHILCDAAKFAMDVKHKYKLEAEDRRGREVRTALTKSMRDHCLGTIADFEEQKLVWINSYSSVSMNLRSKRRPKRQLGILMGAAVAVGSAMYGIYELEQLASGMVSQQALNIELLQSHETRLSVDERSISILNDTLVRVAKEALGIGQRVLSSEHLMQLHIAIESHTEDYQRVIGGFQLLGQHRLSPRLVNLTALPTALERLKSKLEKQEYSMDAAQLEDIFHYSVSHVMFDSGMLVIFCHIPTYRTGSKLTLFEFHALPMQFHGTNNDDSYIRVVEDNRYLAISDTEGLFQQMTPDQWSGCSQVLGNWVCENNNFYHHQKGESCLFGLFRKDSEMIRTHCSWDVHPVQDSGLQVGPNSFLLFQTELRRIKLTCPGQQKAETAFVGLRKVHVPAGCRLLTEYLVFDGQLDVLFSGPKLDFHRINVTEVFAPILGGSTNATALLGDIAKVGSAKGLKIRDLHALYDAAQSSSIWTHGIGITTIAIMVILCSAGGFGAYFACRKRQGRPYFAMAPAAPVHPGLTLHDVHAEVCRIFAERDVIRAQELDAINRQSLRSTRAGSMETAEEELEGEEESSL